jgi:long-chain acyl-CoA synthetase
VVIGTDVAGNSEPCAVLLLKNACFDPEAVVKRANRLLAEYQHIRQWHVWAEEDFPRTSTQKPRISLIRDTVRAKLSGEGKVPATGDALADLISRITGRATGKLSAEANLSADLQLSSIERVELLGALEDRYQVDINETRFTEATTIGELEQMLRQPVPARSDYRYPRWTQSWPVAALRFAVYYLLSWPATILMARPAIRGREALRGLNGPLLIISNHITQVDVGFILLALPPRLRHRLAVAMLGEMLRAMRNPPESIGIVKCLVERLSYFLVVALFNVFPLPQQTGFRESFAFAGECADRGYSILVFPEGRRTQDGKLSPFRAGIGMLAKNLDLPVVPIRIDGLFEMKQKGKKLARPGSVRVTIGSPMRFASTADPEQIAAILEKSIGELKQD